MPVARQLPLQSFKNKRLMIKLDNKVKGAFFEQKGKITKGLNT